ncbi:helix-turn-helix domain-containing protein [Reyranella sp.]|uniref:helix-turn-helix domain-containing protein n=1 Tax=Reyranella sp. TaxID=1929291 RepID=UPI002731E40C|nr:helix-turn-helix domain-containing protein [Reyranella sp.]MDP2374388.1 helix-turn-helix domain-containing protein [Reyranella sp.]
MSASKQKRSAGRGEILAPLAQLHSEFAKRLELACEDHNGVPDLHRGRLRWIRDQFEELFGIEVSTESVRKWLAGEARPRPDKLVRLAELLRVDTGWLSFGSGLEEKSDERARNALAHGAVNIVAAAIQLAGGSIAFPDPHDANARNVHLFAIIKGVQYRLQVVLAHSVDAKHLRFSIPLGFEDCVVLGIVPVGPFKYDVVELDGPTIRNHVQSKNDREIVVSKGPGGYVSRSGRLRKISNLADRL